MGILAAGARVSSVFVRVCLEQKWLAARIWAETAETGARHRWANGVLFGHKLFPDPPRLRAISSHKLHSQQVPAVRHFSDLTRSDRMFGRRTNTEVARILPDWIWGQFCRPLSKNVFEDDRPGLRLARVVPEHPSGDGWWGL
jgi:hypothetical protein